MFSPTLPDCIVRSSSGLISGRLYCPHFQQNWHYVRISRQQFFVNFVSNMVCYFFRTRKYLALSTAYISVMFFWILFRIVCIMSVSSMQLYGVQGNPTERRNAMLFALKERGQGLVEYALILVLVAIVVISALLMLGPMIGNTFSTINNSLQRL